MACAEKVRRFSVRKPALGVNQSFGQCKSRGGPNSYRAGKGQQGEAPTHTARGRASECAARAGEWNRPGAGGGRRKLLVGDLQHGASASTDAAEAARCEANASANSAACVPTVSSCATTFGSEQLSALSKRVSSVFTVAPNGVGQPRSVHDRTQRRQHGAGRLPAVGRDDQADRTAVEIRAIVRAQFLERVECVLHEAGDAAVIAGRRDDDRVGAHGVDRSRCASVSVLCSGA